MATGGAPAPARLVRFTTGAAVLVTAAVFAALLVRDSFVASHRIVAWVVACSVVALLVDPVVALLERWLPRWLSVVIVVLGTFTVLVGVIAGLAREVMGSLDELADAAPAAARDLEQRYEWAVDVDLAARVGSFVEELDESIREGAIDRTVGTLPTYLVTGVLMLFLLGYGRRYVLGALGLFDDLQRRQLARRVVFAAGRRGRRYLLASILQCLTYGAIVAIACRLLGVPAPLSLGASVTLFTAIPLIGTLIGGLPALLLAYGSEGWDAGTAVLVLLIALQFLEVASIRPTVDRRSVRLGTTVPVIVALIAFDLYGVGAAVYAVAVAVLALAALDAYGTERDREGSDLASLT